MKTTFYILTVLTAVGCVRSSQISGVTVPVKATALDLSSLSASNATIATSVEVGKSTTTSVTLNNASEYTATKVQVSPLVAPWSVSENNCASIPAKSSCVLKFTFTPISVGASSTEVKVTFSNGSTTFSLSATSYGLVTVDPVYPSNGANWNDYVINSNGGTNRYDQPDAACTGTENYYDACIHGGEKKKITLKYTSSCDGLTFTEELGMFNWVCKVVKGTAYYYSVSIKDEKKLSDLIETTGTAFKSNAITVYKSGALLYKSESKKWWTNSVTTLPSNPNSGDAVVTLSTAGTIYTLTQSATTSGYNINADKIAITTLNNSVLSWIAGAPNNCSATGETASPTLRCLVASGTQNFLWIEGDYFGGTSVYMHVHYSANHIRVRKMTAQNGAMGFMAQMLKNSLVEKVYLQGLSSSGVSMSNAGAKNNVLYEISVFNATSYGFAVNTPSTIVTKGVAHSSTQGFSKTAASASGQIYSLVTILNTGGTGMDIAASPGHKLSQIYQQNDFWDGFFIQTGTSDSQAQLVSLDNSSSSGLVFASEVSGFFTGNLIFNGNSINCDVSGGTNPGLVTTSCANQGSSNANAITSLSSSASILKGKVTTDDTKNSFDTNGTALYSDIATNFSRFENMYRGWGKDGSTFPNADNTGNCTSGTCRIWDLRFNASDNVLRGKSNDGVTAETFTSGKTCPQAVNGSKSWVGVGTAYYLWNAVEIMADDIGNDNGLCESSEACIFQPNYGAYLGEGDYLSNGTCAFQDGNVTGVTMYAYPTNGG